MNFSSEIYQKIYNDIDFSSMLRNNSRGMRSIVYDSGTRLVYSVNSRTRLREFFISILDISPRVQFPKWYGLDIKIVQMHQYKAEEQYIFLEQAPQSEGYIFEIVVEDLRSTLSQSTSQSETFKTVCTILQKWKYFFQNNREIILGVL